MEDLKCPTVNPERAVDAAVFGIVVDGRVRYLDKPEPLGDEHRTAAHPARVEETFRITGTCYHCKTHWDGEKNECRLAARIPTLLAEIDPPEAPLAPCPIRFDGAGGCRHFAQEGEAICRSCPHYTYAAHVIVPAGNDRNEPIPSWERYWL
jgi:hypothetical protein